MKVKSLILFFILGSSIFAQDIEVIALSVEGSVYVKKAGKRFAETIKLDTRYAEGSQIKTNENSSVELLLSDSSVITLEESIAWTVGEDLSRVSSRTDSTKRTDLWSMTIGMLDKVNASAANSNIVGSIRVTGVEKPLLDSILNANEERELKRALDAISIANEFAKIRMKALVLESFGQKKSAHDEFLNAMGIAPHDSGFNQIIDFLECMLKDADRPGMAEEIIKKRR